MSYMLVDSPVGQILRRDADGAFIPADPGNLDWQAYQAWLKAGNKPAKPAAQPAAKKAAAKG